MAQIAGKELVEKRLQEFTEYGVEEFETKLVWYRKVLEEKSEATDGGTKSAAITGSKEAVAASVALATGETILGPAIGGVMELTGKKAVSYLEQRDNKKEADALSSLVYYFKDKENQPNVRKVLIETCFEIFVSYEDQFMSLTTKNGGETRAMLKLAKDAMNRIIKYYIENQEDDFTVDSLTESLVYKKDVKKNVFKSFMSKLSSSGRTVEHKNEDKLDEWNTKELFLKVGLQMDEELEKKYYTMHGLEPRKYGYRKPFTWETEDQNELKKLYSVVEDNDELIKYNYLLNMDDKKNQVDRLFSYLNERDPERMEERLKETCLSIKKEILEALENNIGSLKIGDTSINIEMLIENINKSETEVRKTILELSLNNKQYFESARKDREEKHKESVNLITANNDLLLEAKLELQETNEKVGEIHSLVLEHVMTQANIPISFQICNPVVPFIGRVSELSALKWAQTDKIMTVICGPRGVGKSELAIKYAHDFKHDNTSNIIWINADTHETLISSFKDLSVLVGFSLDGKNMTTIIKETFVYFSSRKSLFIFDNSADDNVIVNNLSSFVGLSDFIHVIITSQSENWNNNFKVIQLNKFSKKKSREFIKAVLSKNVGGKLHLDDENCNKLATVLECSPLALSKATAYIIQQNILKGREVYTIDDYINQFGKKVLVVVPVSVVPPPSDEVLEKKLLKVLERETNRIGDQISDEAARAEKRVKKFFKNEVGGFFKKL